MSKRYTNCPTCGGVAYYTGENFKEAGALITAQNDIIKNDLRNIVKANAILELSLMDALKNANVNNLSSEILLELYIKAVKREEIEREEKNKINSELFRQEINFDFKKFGLGEW